MGDTFRFSVVEKPKEYNTFDRKEIVNLSAEKISSKILDIFKKMEFENIVKKTSPNDIFKLESVLSLASDGDISYREADRENRISAGYSVTGNSALKEVKFEIQGLQHEMLSKLEEALREKFSELKLDPEKGYTIVDWKNDLGIYDEKVGQENVNGNTPYKYFSSGNDVSGTIPAERMKH